MLNKIGGNPYRFNPPTKWIKEGTVDNNLASINRFLIKMKEHIIKTGILHFDDCYFLADAYIKNKNGDIYVDGKRIERAMLNGKHIFGEQVKTMVNSIMAKEAGLIKVYDEIDEESEIFHGDSEKAKKRKIDGKWVEIDEKELAMRRNQLDNTVDEINDGEEAVLEETEEEGK